MKKVINPIMQKFKTLSNQPGFKFFLSSLIAIVSGIVISFIIMLISSPQSAFQGLGRLLMGPLNNSLGFSSGVGQILYRATPLIFTGLSVAFAFKTGVFNIGASGQYTMGLFVALLIGVTGESLGSLRWIFALLGGGLAGAIWGAIPGLFKSFYQVNVVITGIMFNYIGLFLVNGLLGGPLFSTVVNAATNRTVKVPSSARTPLFFLDKIFPNSGVDFGIIIAIIFVILIYFVLNKTIFGRELKSVGLNPNVAKYAGINEKKSIIISMAISGFLAGIGGALFILAQSVYNLGNDYALETVVLSAGFDGIPIALLGNSNPIGVLFSALFVTYIKVSDIGLQSIGISSETVSIVVAIILYFSAFSLFFGEKLSKFIKNREKNKNLKELKEDNE